MRRVHVITVLVLTLLLTLAQPVAAGGKFQFSGKFAEADWTLGATHSFFVWVFDGKFGSPPGRPSSAKQVFVGGHEEFCIVEEDILVIRDFWGGDTPDSLTIDERLMSASVHDESLPVWLDEVHLNGCDEPDWDNPEYSSHEGYVTLSADWEGSGSLVRTRNSSSYDAGPDCKVSFRSNSTSRSATATASLRGASEVDLGAGDLAGARIASTKDSELVIGNGC